MRDVRIRPAEADDVPCIAERVREADRVELWDGWRHTPTECMELGLHRSRAYTGCINGQPLCMFGVVPASLVCGVGSPWLVGTADLERHQVTFLRQCRGFVADLRRGYTELCNIVDARNEATVRWLTWLDFKVGDPLPFGPDRRMFRPFWWRAHV